MSKRALSLIRENIQKHQRGEDARYLELGNCGLTRLPPELGECVWLETLILSNTWWEYDLEKKEWATNLSQNKSEPNRIGSIKGIEKLSNLRKLVVAKHSFDSGGNWKLNDLVPLAGLSKLQKLDCSNTQIRDLAPLAKLTNLQDLWCYSTHINDLVPLAGLRNLRHLNCSFTQIYDLVSLARLSKLQILNCTSTQIRDLVPLVGLSNLQQLWCSFTRISDLVPLAKLGNLQELWCTSTQISDLTPLAKLSDLQQLECSSTQISDLSPILSLIKKGVPVEWERNEFGISVKDCPLVHPPVDIVQQGNDAIVKWFEDLEKQGSKQLNEAKLLILGEGGVGKTTLAEKVCYGFKQPLPEVSTHGIDILTYNFPCANGQAFKANIWDFGGQEIYHATHQFFLTKRSLYILVDDARKEDTRFDYWLQIVELLSDSSPVIIVQNCKAGRRRDLDEAGLRGRFPNIKAVVYLDLSEDEAQFDGLLERIQLELKAMPHTNESWPLNWANARAACEQLRQEGTRRISYEQFEAICIQNDVDQDTVPTLGQYLHDLGVVLYFHDDPLLRRTVFLDSQWMVNGVYEVLDDTGIKAQHGRFARQDAAAIWEKSAYRHLHDELLQLMMKFELCYPIPDTTDQYIVPHLLPASTPTFDWDERNSLQLHYRYAFMPKGLLSRLIVRLHRFVKNTDLAWRTGVVFERAGTRMRVVETYGEKYLRLHSIGPQSRELLTIVSDEIDRLNSSYRGMKGLEKLVPCNCPTCLRLDMPNFYDYNDLMQRKERGKRTIECRNSYYDVDVLRLLDHVFMTTFFNPKTPKVFISYSKEDRVHLETLKKHLSVLSRGESLLTWDDTQLIPGEEWDRGIKQQLATADIILLLVSSDFMATDYIWQEIEIAIERHRNAEAVVVPIIVRPCSWESAPFAQFAALPDKGKPVTKWDNPDEAWVLITKRIREVVERIRNTK